MATSDSWVQDSVTCDLCDNPTQQFCNSCQVSLCDTCVKKHREDFSSLSHDIVPFLDRKIQLVCPECQHHPGQRCEANCLRCSVPVCFKCVISGPHEKHKLEELTKTHEKRTQRIAVDTDEIKSELIPKYQGKNITYESSVSETHTQFVDLLNESKKLRQLWHQEVDNIFDKIDSISQSHRKENLNVLHTYHNKIKKLIFEMNKIVEQNEKLLKSKNFSEVNKYKSKLKEFRDFLHNVDLKLPSFHSKIEQGKELSIEFGDYRAILNQMLQTSLLADFPPCISRIWEQMDKVRVTTTISTEYKPLLGVACVGEAEAWIFGENQTITRIDIHGIVKNTVTNRGKTGLSGISVTRERELMQSDRDRRTVNIVRNGMPEICFTTPEDWSPKRLCCSRSGEIFVHICKLNIRATYTNKIIRYQGQSIQQEICNDRHGNLIFKDGSDSLFITENNNGDICVSDTNANTVVVVDKWGRVQYSYDGIKAKKKGSFHPRGIVTDVLSNIIVADINNECLHILDQNGLFLRCIDDCKLEKPFALSVDSDWRLWVGFFNSRKIRVIEYLKNK
ncbi:uncharacterized protein LOC111111540 [Crassostrea virginica]